MICVCVHAAKQSSNSGDQLSGLTRGMSAWRAASKQTLAMQDSADLYRLVSGERPEAQHGGQGGHSAFLHLPLTIAAISRRW
jgi:hypothetical protein